MITKINFIKGYKNKKSSISKSTLQKSLKAGSSSYKDRKKTYKNIIQPISSVTNLYKSKEQQYNILKSFSKKVFLNSLNLNSQKLLLQHPTYSLISEVVKKKLTKKDLNLSIFLLVYLF
uniref:Ribosomal protein L20 n=1 Tax=Apicomplexa sp. corallicolid ex Leiopathes glaberrima TaxID=2720216 RepID=A0A6M3R5I7_9APIC|nr:ribosomal protein L20 [Apicomplexa sp. corallicolid ex Leiopathes glaberrima]